MTHGVLIEGVKGWVRINTQINEYVFVFIYIYAFSICT